MDYSHHMQCFRVSSPDTQPLILSYFDDVITRATVLFHRDPHQVIQLEFSEDQGKTFEFIGGFNRREFKAKAVGA